MLQNKALGCSIGYYINIIRIGGQAMSKLLLWVICLLYIISPLDLVPGPVDDAIVGFVTYGITSMISK